MDTYGLWINGQELLPSDRPCFETLEPATGVPWARVVGGTVEDVDLAVDAAERAGAEGSIWRSLTPATRRKLLFRVADRIRENAEMLARVESRDAGKLLLETRLHVQACAEWVEFFAGYTDKVPGSTIPTEPGVFAYTVRQPVGVVGAIVPGNSPLLLTVWKLAPALAMANTLVVKPSENTTASIIELMRVLQDLLPPGVVNVVSGPGPEVGTAIAAHQGIRKIAFTGGTLGGSHVASVAAARFVPSILELGGKSANIVFADAVREKALAGVMAGVFAASGQTCMAGSRVFVEESAFDEVVEELTRRGKSIVVGHPEDPSTQVGPLGSARQLSRVEGLVKSAVADGAVVHFGGTVASVPGVEGGYYFQPTLLSNVPTTSELYRQEVFGPVVSVSSFSTEDEVVALANDSDFGLVAGLWTTSLSRAHRMAERLEVGTVFVNLYRKVMPQVPFGGRKASGFGRENGIEVVHEYTQVKSVLIDVDDSHIQDPFLMRVGDEG